MNRYKPIGWINESQRHSLASKGIKTGRKTNSCGYKVVGASQSVLDNLSYRRYGENYSDLSEERKRKIQFEMISGFKEFHGSSILKRESI